MGFKGVYIARACFPDEDMDSYRARFGVEMHKIKNLMIAQNRKVMLLLYNHWDFMLTFSHHEIPYTCGNNSNNNNNNNNNNNLTVIIYE